MSTDREDVVMHEARVDYGRPPPVHPFVDPTTYTYQYTPIRGAFVHKKTQKSLPGLHPIMGSIFYPHYCYSLAHASRHQVRMSRFTVTHHAEVGSEMRHCVTSRTSHQQAMQLGKRIDQEIQWSVRLANDYHLPKRYFLSPACRRSSTFAHVPRRLRDKVDELHPYTQRFWHQLAKLKWHALAAQVGVGCRTWKVATAVDVLCLDAFNRYRVVEIKVGGLKYYCRSSGYMAWPFRDVEDCPYHQHMLQAALTNELFMRTYRNSARARAKVGDPVVMRFVPSAVHVLQMQPWVHTGMRELQAIHGKLTELPFLSVNRTYRSSL